MTLTRPIAITLALAMLGVAAQEKLKTLKPGMNFFSKDQDIQLGKEAAAQVQQQMTIVNNPQLEGYVRGIASKIWAQPQAGGFPYSIKVVNDPAINAFALPGGPTFIQTGLIAAAENDAQIAGVLAHETAHVALRHGTHQASKAQLIQLPAMLAGAMAGGSLLGQLAQLGIGLGANSVLLKYSRDAESQADYLGTEMMAQAGYNPIELSRFFEKLEAQSGKGGSVAQFFSDHPNPGNRVKAIEDEIRLLPQKNYTTGDPAELRRMQAIVKTLPPPKKSNMRSQLAPSSGQSGASGIEAIRPSRNYREYDASISFQYPDNWQVYPGQNSSEITIAPRAAIAQDQSGQTAIGAGVIVNLIPSENRGDLKRDTQQLIQRISQGNRDSKVGNTSQIKWNGSPALSTQMQSPSPFQGETELDTIVTVERPQGLLYVIMITPQSLRNDLQPAFDQFMKSLKTQQ